MIEFLSRLIGLKKAYFSKEAYIKFAETDAELSSSVLLNLLTDVEANWYDILDGERVLPLSEGFFRTKKEKYSHLTILSEWVEWR